MDSSQLQLVLLGFTLFFLYQLASALRSPLRGIPGPFWARFTNIWRLLDHYNSTQALTQRRLHDELGPAVRLGPNLVSLSDPSLIKTIYSTRGTFLKTDFYSVNDAVQDGQTIQNVFGTRSNEYHSKYMRPIQKLYSIHNVLSFEPLMDKTLSRLCEQLDSRFANTGKICDIAPWLNFNAWDIVGEVTFSRDMGFLKAGVDLNDMIRKAEIVVHYFGVAGQMPIIDRLIGKNPYSPIKLPTFANAAGYCYQRFYERVSPSAPSSAPDPVSQSEKGEHSATSTHHTDFLAGYLEAQKLDPETIGDDKVVGYLLINILAGADSTAITQKAILYHVLKNPRVHRKLVSELLSATSIPSFSPSSSSSSCTPAPYTPISTLPYLTAVIRESMRIHPPVGVALERVVPSSGLEVPAAAAAPYNHNHNHGGGGGGKGGGSGGVVHLLPPGTAVAMNQWVLSRDKGTYGEDVDVFRPERWLRDEEGEGETEEGYAARLKRMQAAYLTWGGGNRVCLGKHMAMVALYKATATLFGRYDIQLENPDHEWTTHLWWFTYVEDIPVKILRRQAAPIDEPRV